MFLFQSHSWIVQVWQQKSGFKGNSCRFCHRFEMFCWILQEWYDLTWFVESKVCIKEAIPWQVNEFQAGIWYCPANGDNRQTNADFVTSPSKGPECLQIVANLYCIFFKKVASSKRKVLSYWLFCYNCGIKGHPSTACLKAKQKHHRFKQSEIHWGKNTRYYAFTRWTRWITCTLKESRRCTSIILRWGEINESLLPQQ